MSHFEAEITLQEFILHFDVILLKQTLGGMGGCWGCGRLKKHPWGWGCALQRALGHARRGHSGTGDVWGMS